MTKEVCVGKEENVLEGSEGPQAATESGRVRPEEGNKEIMAPRCVCSRMEGGEAAAFWEKPSGSDSVGRYVLALY